MRNTITTGLLTIVLFLSGCSFFDPNGDLTGSVFIVTSGAESYKLALVKVYFCDVNDIKSEIAQDQQEFNTNVQTAKQACDKAQTNFTDADSTFIQAHHAFDASNKHFFEIYNSLNTVQHDLQHKFADTNDSRIYSPAVPDTLQYYTDHPSEVTEEIGKEIDQLKSLSAKWTQQPKRITIMGLPIRAQKMRRTLFYKQ